MRLIVADDSVIVRDGLERLLTAEGHDVVATLTRADELEAAVEKLAPDGVVVDIRTPPTHTDEGLRTAVVLRRRHPELAILVLSQYVVPEYAMRLLKDGERYTGYLLKDRIPERHELVRALERLRAGGTVVDPELVGVMFATSRRDDLLVGLTEREREVLQLFPALAQAGHRRVVVRGTVLHCGIARRAARSASARAVAEIHSTDACSRCSESRRGVPPRQ